MTTNYFIYNIANIYHYVGIQNLIHSMKRILLALKINDYSNLDKQLYITKNLIKLYLLHKLIHTTLKTRVKLRC